MPEHIIIAGDHSVGKSTTATNLAAALAEAGHRVAVIGYDPHRNSTLPLRRGSKLLPGSGNSEPASPLFTIGYKDTLCVEAGELTQEMGPHWLSARLNPLLTNHGLYYHGRYFILHDLWYRHESPFLLPPTLQQEAPRLLLVSSGEMASMQVLNQFFQWLNNISSSDCRFSGVIINNIKNNFHELILNDYVSRTGTSAVARFPHSLIVSLADYLGQTLIESAPNSHNSILYHKLAQQIVSSKIAAAARPTFFDETELEHWSRKWYESLSRMESGVVMDGSGI